LALLVKDRFEDACARGEVKAGDREFGNRIVVDVERVMSIDDGALRIQPLLKPGWGKACLSYGPFKAQAGLAFGVFMLNGHNTSQMEVMSDTLRVRLKRWAMGSGDEPARHRLLRWLLSGRVKRVARQMLWWRYLSKWSEKDESMDENLAIGFFSKLAARPSSESTCFVMHATGPENGELWIRSENGFSAAVRGVQNLQIHFIVILRCDDAIYYTSSVQGAHGTGFYPNLRPMFIGPKFVTGDVYASIHQSILGQIGFRADTRVYDATVAQFETYNKWYGGAHAADWLAGVDSMDERHADVGGVWKIIMDNLEHFDKVLPGDNVVYPAVLDPGRPSGLIKAKILVEPGNSESIALIWRCRDIKNYWAVMIFDDFLELGFLGEGTWNTIAKDNLGSPVGTGWTILIQDSGRDLSVFVNGALKFGRRFSNDRLAEETKVGIGHWNPTLLPAIFGQFEAHPRQIEMLPGMGQNAPWFRLGSNVEIKDDFGELTGDLNGRITPVGKRTWTRTFGRGVIELTGNYSARIQGTRERPCPGRTFYSLAWHHRDFADLTVTITPPGKERGQRENGISGFVLLQDENNFLLVNTWLKDSYDGASISSFFKINGFEDLYDAIWTNVGSRIRWGCPARLRLISDGMNYIVLIDEEPVLYRALSDVYTGCHPLKIRQVGLQSNWEWGFDTGSVFEAFEARY
jgi:hypothetical protein